MKRNVYFIFFKIAVVTYIKLVTHYDLISISHAAAPESKRISLGVTYGLLVLSDPSEGTAVLEGSGMEGQLKIGKCFFRDQWLCPNIYFGYFYESWVRSRDYNGSKLKAAVVLDGPILGASLDLLPLSKFVSTMPISVQPVLRIESEGGFGGLLSSVPSSTADEVEASQTFTHYSYGLCAGLQISLQNGLYFKGFSGISRRSRKLRSTTISSNSLFYGGVVGMPF